MTGFEQQVGIAEAAGPWHGKYLATYRSANGQVMAYIFEKNGGLVAHVGMPTGLHLDELSDTYYDELHQFAREHGFENRLRIIYVEHWPQENN
jgi:hypothetical protein